MSESQDEVTSFRVGLKSIEKWNENTGRQLDRFERADGSSPFTEVIDLVFTSLLPNRARV